MKVPLASTAGAVMLLTAAAHAAGGPRINGQICSDIQTVMMTHIDQDLMGCARCQT
jgi:hypothetical protein